MRPPITCADAPAGPEASTPARPRPTLGRDRRHDRLGTRVPDARVWQVDAAIREACVRLGHGLTMDDIVDAWQHATGVTERPDLQPDIRRLKALGLVVTSDAPSRSLRYRHRDTDVPFAPPDAFAPRVLTALDALFAEIGRPITALEVTTRLRASAVQPPYRGAVAGTLWNESLPTTFTSGETRAPRVLELRVEAGRERTFRGYVPNTERGQAVLGSLARVTGPATGDAPGMGRVLSFAALVALLKHGASETRDPSGATTAGGQEAVAALALIDLLPRQAALRCAVACAGDALGLPVHGWHLRLWRAAQPDPTAWASAFGGGFRQAFTEAARLKYRATTGGLSAVIHGLTGYGVAQARLWVGAADARTHAAVAIDDALTHLRVAAEREAVANIAAEPWVRGALRDELPAIRQRALHAALAQALADCVWADLPAIAARLQHAWVVTERWSGALRPNSPERTEWRQRAATAQANIAALEEIAASPANGVTGPAPARVGTAGTTVTLADLDAALRHAGLLLGIERPASLVNLIAGARRCVPPDRPGVNPMHAAAPTIDRADALLALFRAIGLPRASALLDHGHAVLGHVLRDRVVLADLLTRAAPSDAPGRRALVVALGLLGVAPAWATAAPTASDGFDAAAFALATSCATLDARAALAAITAALRTATGAARTMLSEAAAQLRTGDLLTVVG